jgi:TRAP-type transport system periplasmic protein
MVFCVGLKLAPECLGGFAQKQGRFLLATWENGFRQITNNVRPIVQPKDLCALKLRTPKGVWRVKPSEAYGAAAFAAGLGVVQMRLADHTFDGQENPLSLIEAFRLYEVEILIYSIYADDLREAMSAPQPRWIGGK